MTKLIIMFILAGGGPIVIQGWNSMAACEAAKTPLETFYKERQAKATYGGRKAELKCLELANNP
jgi:hypothetical protein